MKTIILCLLCACGPSLPAETLREYAQVLEATKSAYYVTCVQLLTRSPETDAKCLVADAHLNSAIDLYMELGD